MDKVRIYALKDVNERKIKRTLSNQRSYTYSF